MGASSAARGGARAMLALLLAATALRTARAQYKDPCGDYCTTLHRLDVVADTVRPIVRCSLGNQSETERETCQSETEEETWHLLNLNDLVRPDYLGKEHGRGRRNSGIVMREVLDAEFYITKLPDVGQLFQAYRPAIWECDKLFPASCGTTCCSARPRTTVLPSGEQLTSCCHARGDEQYGGQRLFLIGDEITSVPAKVAAAVMSVAGEKHAALAIAATDRLAASLPRNRPLRLPDRPSFLLCAGHRRGERICLLPGHKQFFLRPACISVRGSNKIHI